MREEKDGFLPQQIDGWHRISEGYVGRDVCFTYTDARRSGANTNNAGNVTAANERDREMVQPTTQFSEPRAPISSNHFTLALHRAISGHGSYVGHCRRVCCKRCQLYSPNDIKGVHRTAVKKMKRDGCLFLNSVGVTRDTRGPRHSRCSVRLHTSSARGRTRQTIVTSISYAHSSNSCIDAYIYSLHGCIAGVVTAVLHSSS